MDDLEFRRRVLSGEINSSEIRLAAAQDAERQRWLAQAETLEQQLDHQLSSAVPAGLAERLKQIPAQHPKHPASMAAQHPQRRSRWQPFAAAAAFVLAFSSVLYMSPFANNAQQLSGAVLSHIADEPNTLYNHTPVSAATVNLVAGRLGYRFNEPQRQVSYAGTCALKGKQAVHLTIQHQGSSASVFLMPGETIDGLHDFTDHHLHGRLIPLAQGSAAIVSTSPALLDQLQQTTLSELGYTARAQRDTSS